MRLVVLFRVEFARAGASARMHARARVRIFLQSGCAALHFSFAVACATVCGVTKSPLHLVVHNRMHAPAVMVAF